MGSSTICLLISAIQGKYSSNVTTTNNLDSQEYKGRKNQIVRHQLVPIVRRIVDIDEDNHYNEAFRTI